MKDEMYEMIKDFERKAENKGYVQGVWDFYKLICTTHSTPKEIYEYLIDGHILDEK